MPQWHKASDEHFTLKDSTTHIWLTDLDVPEARLRYLYPLLSAKEKERAERFKFFRHKRLFIASHGFMRSVLAQYLNLPPEAITSIETEHGKPVLDPALFAKTGVHFNLSHSGTLALLAISMDCEVGIDIEYVDRKNRWEKIIKRFFTLSEQADIFDLPEDQQKKAFFQTWTRKEAYMKALGHGLSLAPDTFTLTIPPRAPALVSHDTDKYPAPDIVRFADIEIPDSFGPYAATFSILSDNNDARYFVFSEPYYWKSSSVRPTAKD